MYCKQSKGFLSIIITNKSVNNYYELAVHGHELLWLTLVKWKRNKKNKHTFRICLIE